MMSLHALAGRLLRPDHRFAHHLLAALLALLLSACATTPAPTPQACPAAPACAPCPVCPTPPAPPPPPAKPLEPARWEELPGWREARLGPAHAAFLESCKALARRPAWLHVCQRARELEGADEAALRRFYETEFAPFQLVNPDGSRDGLITGYYEPVLKGARSRDRKNRYPVYGVPDDLLVIDLGELYPELKAMRLRGRLDGRKVVPYYSRAELEQRAPQLRDKVLYWVEDPIELFFLQIQGSGQIQLADGSRVRIGYADQNGHPYRSVGRYLINNGGLPAEQASMQGIKAWARANPQRLDELLNTNPSFVFFRDIPLDSAGPLGALGVPLTPARSLAVDPRTTPLGAPVYLDTTRPGADEPLRQLMVAQDTGGAIKGPVRADFFWGLGPEAGALAGNMKQSGRMWVLLPPALAPR
ncbi:MAG: murein transglycosylase A [Pseudomonadota bacterium]